MGPSAQTQMRRGPVIVAVSIITLVYFLLRSSLDISSPTIHNTSQPVDLSTDSSILSFQSDTARKLQRIFPYEPALHRKYPRQIWQTWKYSLSDARFSSKFHRAADSWTINNPGYAHEVLDDDSAAALIRQLYAPVPEVVDAYFSMPKPILRADFFRYLILLARGGTYSDIDTTSLRGVDKWFASALSGITTEDGSDRKILKLSQQELDDYTKRVESGTGLIVGIEADPDRPDWNEWYARRVQFCQWTILSKKGHPVLTRIVSRITTETLRRKAINTLTLPTTKDAGSQIMDWTGPGIWTDSIFDYLASIKPGTTWKNVTALSKAKIIGDVMILPITSFSPGVGTMGAENPDHLHAFVQHIFEGSWKPESERQIGGGGG
ncbi:nucleotide-diphospho-sugar transferase [Lipomyces arxii]|uniref:nucleotide-diphospho-sugar transferase n=1 Tax=Lipomyces arxii TaxID=56418 RepID=UPI0034CEE921